MNIMEYLVGVNGMKEETYKHILDNSHLLELDLINGKILNRKEDKPDKKGYLCVTLAKKKVRQHQVFAIERWGDTCIGMTINHINEVKTDNSWENLELLTNTDNMRVRSFRYDNNDKKQLIKGINIDTGEEIIFDSQREAAKHIGTSPGNVSRIIKGKRKTIKRYTFEKVV